MANINLISARRAERLRMTRIARGLVFALVGTGALGVATAGFFTMQLFLAKGRISATDAELEKLRPILSQIQEAERERMELRPKLATLTEAQRQTRRWFGIMESLKRAVPEQTWLTNLAVERPGEGPDVVRINGMTVTQSRVGETMYRLTQQPEFYQKVELRYTQTTRVDSRENVEFELAAQLYQPELQKSGETNAPQGQ